MLNKEKDSSRRPTIWFEVDDFIRYFDRAPNPSGIQRVQMEIFAAAHAQQERPGILFGRLNRLTRRYEIVDFDSLAAIFRDPPLAEADPELASSGTGPMAWFLKERRKFRDTRRQFYDRVRERFHQLVGWYLHFRHMAAPEVPFQFGDILLGTGASWEDPRYEEAVASVRHERGVRFAAIVYDLIHLTHPQWVGKGAGMVFRRWLNGVLANAELILTISNHSRSVLASYAAGEGRAVPRIEVLSLGVGFRLLPSCPIGDRAIAKLPSAYVVYVSTLEPRKNHQLLFRVWSRLIEKHGAPDVPSLVFVGRRGWLIDDFLVELQQSGFLAGKIILLSSLSDAELQEVYRRCLFSVFPSFVEGWGLPVSESLEHGKLCIASNRASIPEVGGNLVNYIDPENDAGSLAAIERAIFDNAYRNEREARIRAEYRPTSWGRCVEVLMASLDRLSESGDCLRPQGRPAAQVPLSVGGAS